MISRTRARGFEGHEEYGSGKETTKSPSPPGHHQHQNHHHHSSPYQRQQEQRTYPAPGQYRHSPIRRGPASESDKPSSLIADTYKQDKAVLEAKEEPVEQPDAFGSGFPPLSTGQSYDVDNWEDKHSAPPSRPRLIWLLNLERCLVFMYFFSKSASQFLLMISHTYIVPSLDNYGQ